MEGGCGGVVIGYTRKGGGRERGRGGFGLARAVERRVSDGGVEVAFCGSIMCLFGL